MLNTKIPFKLREKFAQLNWTWIIIGSLGLGLLLTLAVSPSTSRHLKASLLGKDRNALIGSFPVVVPTIKYGFALDTFQVYESEFRSSENLGDILMKRSMTYADIDNLVRNSKDVFDVRDLTAGKPYLILSKDSTQGPDYLIYEPSVYKYYVFHLNNEDSLFIEKVERPITTAIRSSGVTVESSLWESMERSGADPALIKSLEDALKWSVDFHHLNRGEQFKAVYDQHYVEGQPVDPGRVHAALYKSENKENYAFYYESPHYTGYYDQEGRPMKKGFLRAPVKYARISSGFNLRRFHPILRTVRPHFGTDYAAPYGTPIIAVGDGTVLEATRRGGNGNFVKIKHTGQVQTQYLHMQAFARGIHPGARVSQGQVIGYVGATGLATGPHVCFRFWVNGKQVNHNMLKLPPPEPLPKAEMEKFAVLRDKFLEMLKEIPVETIAP
ncbi:MAG: peptidoglycan DD-metalloendopeptidase family protein [Haliscomenobacter sp.]|nr:peptidoglycan DD-metalloendopeptidase family protein [Haliscomenobacter sp.]MBK9491904.1 peptidoglycan DD-metalloendopeptidase family protein [Haliscomenobacter sp.]